SSANAGPLERVDETLRLAAEVLPHVVERGELLDERRAGCDPPLLALPDLAVHVIESLRHRGEQVFDRFLARVDVGLRFGARLLEARLREREELLVVALERLGAERAEGVAQLGFGVLVRLQAFGVNRAIPFDFVLEAHLAGTSGQPADEDAYRKTDR